VPLPRHHVIHPYWWVRQQRTVVGTMTATVKLSHPGRLGERDPVSGHTPMLPPEVYYEGPARIQARNPATSVASLDGRELTSAGYLVAVPLPSAVDPLPGDLVDVLTADDPLLPVVFRRLVVVDIPTASLILQRVLLCDLYQPTPPASRG